MKKRNKKIWIEALRSGKFKQGRGTLYKDGKHCCLGVAYDVLVHGDWVDDEYDRWCIPHIGNSGYDERDELPGYIRRKLGISPDRMQTLISMNDNGHSFNEIADWIEENMKGV